MIVGFVGLGAMGLPMAQNLIANGHAVQGFDLRPEPGQALAAAGGKAVASATEAAAGADVLMLMVVNALQAEQVLFEAGALQALPEGGTVVLTATCLPGEAAAMAARVAAEGRRFVDAPVSGGTAGAKAGSLSIMAGCPTPLFNELKPLFEGFGGKLFHVGEAAGQGQMVKTVNQLLCGAHIAVAAEALSLAEKMGVDPKVALEITGGSAAASWMLNDRGPRMLEADPEVTSAIDIFVKDLGIVLAAGRDCQAALPLAAAAHQLFVSTSGRGDGRADDSQVIRSYALLNGLAARG
ncbi:NAD(P)-dependent oxidoreductase [Brevundimonas sp.]|uniref:NAD(P)-dependent oxidoreductase n=1 Tax=Brevundimonas sp. TaxID=1871086 RepID=UPI002EDB83B4